MKRKYQESICLRVPLGVRDRFIKKAEIYGMSASEIHRELINAFLEDRLGLVKPATNSTLRSLYDN